MQRWALASLLVAGSALAGPYDQAYSLVTTDPARSADPDLRPVIVNRVDGETVLSGRPAVVAPGRHTVTVDLPPRKGFHTATQASLALDVKACTRYHLAAKLESPTSQRWTPVVRSAEPIGECAARFLAAGGK